MEEIHVSKTKIEVMSMETTATTIATKVKTKGAAATSKRNNSSGSRTNNISGHNSLAMYAIRSAANLPPLQCRGITNVEVVNING